MNSIKNKVISLVMLAAMILSLISPQQVKAFTEVDGNGSAETHHGGSYGWRTYGFKAGGTIRF